MLRFSREEIVLFFTGLMTGKTAATAPLNREVLQEALLGEIKNSPQLRAGFLEALQDNPVARMLVRISFAHEFTGKLLREFLAHYPAGIREAAENILPALRQAALFPGTGSKSGEEALLVLYALPGISPGTSPGAFLDTVIRTAASAFHISPELVRRRLAAILAGAPGVPEQTAAEGLQETERYFGLAAKRDFFTGTPAEKNKAAEVLAQWRIKAGETLDIIQAPGSKPEDISSVQEKGRKIIALYLLVLPAELLLHAGTETDPAKMLEHLLTGLPAWISAAAEKKTDQAGETETIPSPGTDTHDEEQDWEFLEQVFRGMISPEEISASAGEEKPERSDKDFVFSPASETIEETEAQAAPDFFTVTENVPGEKISGKEKQPGAAQYERETLISSWRERAYRVLAQFRRNPDYPPGEAYRESAFIAAETMALIRRLENRKTKPPAAFIENEIRYALRSLVLFLEQRISGYPGEITRAGEEKTLGKKKSAEKKQDTDQPKTETEKEKKETPEDPRDLLFTNPSIFLNALVYFFTWHSLPWWSPYKTTEELGRYASILIPKHRELVLHHLAGLFRQQETSDALSVLLADRLHETSETQELVAGNRVIFALLKHLAGKSVSPGDDVFGLLRTGEDIFFLPDEHMDAAKAAALIAAVVRELPGGFRENIFSRPDFAGNEELFDSFLKEVPKNILSLTGDIGLNKEDFRAALQDIAEKIKYAGSSEIPTGEKNLPVPPSRFTEELSQLLKPADYAPAYRFIPLLEQLPADPVSPQENDSRLRASVFAATAIAEGKSIRQLLNPVLRRKQTEQHPFYQALIDLRNAEQLPDSYRVLAAEVQALAAKIAPQAVLPLLRWHRLSAAVSGDYTDMNVYLLALAIHEMAVAGTVTGEAVADTIEALLETQAGEIPFLTSRYLENAKQKLHLFEEPYRNTYTATAAQLKKNRLEISETAAAGTPEKLAVVLARALSKDKDFLEKWKKLPGSQELLRRKKLPEKKQQSDQKKKQPEFETVSAGDPVFVFNAGLVLFWPFIGGLFRKLKYVQGKEFISRELQERAVLLLQYCVDEQDEQPAEHLLPLNKLFCGLDPAAPLERWITLEEAEKNEARVFVSSVKAQWPQMKNTSVPTFLSSFIRREGMLFRKDDNWELQVQHASIDVLLKKLPWGVSTVKFPWSPGILFVKWKI
ncbi:MAG: hypothetical protein FD123_4111 [Bacteroidetes bacterium]|nr:MAG: hypothetical protein FD123_4111 [Bacteroidota bacterium]